MNEWKRIEVGDELDVAAVAWDDGWEFDCPTVAYRGLRAYSPNTHSTHKESVLEWLESKIEDACVDGQIRREFSDSDGKEFEWRGWKRRGFGNRCGTHVRLRVRFVRDKHGDLSFVVLSKSMRYKATKAKWTA